MLLFPVQFDSDPMKGIDRVLGREVFAGLRPTDVIASIDAGLASDAKLSELIPINRSEEVIRSYSQLCAHAWRSTAAVTSKKASRRRLEDPRRLASRPNYWCDFDALDTGTPATLRQDAPAKTHRYNLGKGLDGKARSLTCSGFGIRVKADGLLLSPGAAQRNSVARRVP